MKIFNFSRWFLLGTNFAKKPNVILLIADDLGMGDISINNKMGKIKTPNIDRIGNEGLNFIDAHAPSTRCSPSRFGIMTGRYSFDNSEGDSIRNLKPGTPHLGELFKRNGYITGIVGKHQPILDDFTPDDVSPSVWQQYKAQSNAYMKKVGEASGNKNQRDKMGIKKETYFPQSNYTMPFGPHTASYDYSFINKNGCCRVGAGYFENGKSTEAFSKFGKLQIYPEGIDPTGRKCYIPYDGGNQQCRRKPKGILAPPYTNERINGEILIPSFPISILVQESYDTRELEQRVAEKAIDFINDNAHKEDPFFLYYGFRSGHLPFNSDIRYRGKSDAGTIGEAVMELDDIVGRVMAALKEANIDEDTLIVFMSDNGAINSHTAETAVQPGSQGDYYWQRYQHYQNSVDVDGVNYKLRGGKASPYEGGLRVPFLWRYPRLFSTNKPKVLKEPVSFIDLYRTLANIIGSTPLPCNEAPDSRSMLNFMKGKVDRIIPDAIIHHCIKCVDHVVIRERDMKLIGGNNELYNITADPQELNNLYDLNTGYVEHLTTRMRKIVDRVNDREERSNVGAKPWIC